MNEARRLYYNQSIEDNSTDQRRLFAANKSLLNMKKDRSLPHILFHFLQTILVSFFYCQDYQYQVKAEWHSCCQRPTPTWNMNLVILYFPTSNAKPD